MRRTWTVSTLAVTVVAAAAAAVIAGGPVPDGRPDIEGAYSGKMTIKFRHLEAGGARGRKKEPFTMMLFQDGADLSGFMHLGTGQNVDRLDLSGQVGNGSLYLQTLQAKCAITMVGKSKGLLENTKLKVKGVVIDMDTTEIGEIKFTAEFEGAAEM